LKTVGILGGMGPAAGADFARLFVEACTEHLHRSGQTVNDQQYPEHWLAQVPVPDRTQALLAPSNMRLGDNQPLDALLQALGRLNALGVCSVAIACNTAHAWHGLLQRRFKQIDLLHMPIETAQHLANQGVREVALMATSGTYKIGLFQEALQTVGIDCHLPTHHERSRIMQGIYLGVKANNLGLAQECFLEVVQNLGQRHGNMPIVLGCTEIPLGLQAMAQLQSRQLVDPAKVLANALVSRAYAA
jgi:aspartate racemase